MTRAAWEKALWAAALVVAVWGWTQWRAAVPAATPAADGGLGAPAAVRPWPRETLEDAAGVLAARDPFRLDRRPADARFVATLPGVMTAAAMAPPPPPPERPPLAFVGVVGPPWEALVEGIPGREGAVLVRAGDRVGNYRVRSVRPDLVVVQGPDTTWRLTLRNPWQ